jgi:hypothetical protein
MIEWNCHKCKRTIISPERGRFCLECNWKDLVEKIEINPETIRSFMEKNYFTYFVFYDDPEDTLLRIGVQKEKVFIYGPPADERNLSFNHYLGERMDWNWCGAEYSEGSAFLEKLFEFGKKEKIKRIRGNCKIEVSLGLEKHYFKVLDIIIEKKTTEEIEKGREEEYEN